MRQRTGDLAYFLKHRFDLSPASDLCGVVARRLLLRGVFRNVWLSRLIFATTPTTYNLHIREKLQAKLKRTYIQDYIRLFHVSTFFPRAYFICFSERIFFMTTNENIILIMRNSMGIYYRMCTHMRKGFSQSILFFHRHTFNDAELSYNIS